MESQDTEDLEETFNKYVHWRTIDGTVIKIADMRIGHLRNAIRMVYRMRKEVHPGLIQEWRRRGAPENAWREDSVEGFK